MTRISTALVQSGNGPNNLPISVALDQLLKRLVEEQGEKVVLWSFFRHSLAAICGRYAHYNPVRVDGSVVGSAARAAAVRQFQDDPSVKLFVGNPAAAGAGITLTSSHIAIYESFSMQGAHYLQSLDRIHRHGQEQAVDYYILLCENTIEEDEYDRLLRKEAQAAQLFSDVSPEPLRRELFLNELISGLHRVSLNTQPGSATL